MGEDEGPQAKPQEIVAAVLGLVHELHGRGYQRIRVWPGMAPSGMHWRCAVSTAGNVDPLDDCQAFADWDNGRLFPYTSGMGLVAYDAEAFLTAFPRIAEEGQGGDPAYAHWLAGLLAKARQGYVPVSYADYPIASGVVTLVPFVRGLEEEAYPLAPPPPAG